jgi:hypothetical protein
MHMRLRTVPGWACDAGPRRIAQRQRAHRWLVRVVAPAAAPAAHRWSCPPKQAHRSAAQTGWCGVALHPVIHDLQGASRRHADHPWRKRRAPASPRWSRDAVVSTRSAADHAGGATASIVDPMAAAARPRISRWLTLCACRHLLLAYQYSASRTAFPSAPAYFGTAKGAPVRRVPPTPAPLSTAVECGKAPTALHGVPGAIRALKRRPVAKRSDANAGGYVVPVCARCHQAVAPGAPQPWMSSGATVRGSGDALVPRWTVARSNAGAAGGGSGVGPALAVRQPCGAGRRCSPRSSYASSPSAPTPNASSARPTAPSIGKPSAAGCACCAGASLEGDAGRVASGVAS